MEENIKDSESQDSFTENKTKADSGTSTSTTVNTHPKSEGKSKFSGFSGIKDTIKRVYEKDYKKLLIIPFAVLLAAFVLIGLKVAATGDFINRDVSLKGGVTITVPSSEQIDVLQVKNILSSQFLDNDISTKSLSQFGSQVGIIVEADIEEGQAKEFIESMGRALNRQLTPDDYSVEIVGSSLGASFFKEALVSLGIAFLFMAIVVFLYFRTFVPSAAVILAAFSDMVVTLAIVNLMDMRISAAGIAAFLMLIGYSVDTDILLTTRVLKRKEGTEMEKIYGAIKTGIMMTLTTITATIIGLIFTQSEVIRQIMVILLIGLLADLIFTWIQNVGILRLYLERKAKRLAQ